MMARATVAAAFPRKGAFVLSAVVMAAASACGGTSHSGTTSSSGAACLNRSPSGYLQSARVAFIGIMLPGASVSTSRGSMLVSPTRVRVVRYLKGDGPRIVTVMTAATRNGSTVSLSEDGIQAHAGQRWQIYSTTQRMPYQTSICAGSTSLTSTS